MLIDMENVQGVERPVLWERTPESISSTSMWGRASMIRCNGTAGGRGEVVDEFGDLMNSPAVLVSHAGGRCEDPRRGGSCRLRARPVQGSTPVGMRAVFFSNDTLEGRVAKPTGLRGRSDSYKAGGAVIYFGCQGTRRIGRAPLWRVGRRQDRKPT